MEPVHGVEGAGRVVVEEGGGGGADSSDPAYRDEKVVDQVHGHKVRLSVLIAANDTKKTFPNLWGRREM